MRGRLPGLLPAASWRRPSASNVIGRLPGSADFQVPARFTQPSSGSGTAHDSNPAFPVPWRASKPAARSATSPTASEKRIDPSTRTSVGSSLRTGRDAAVIDPRAPRFRSLRHDFSKRRYFERVEMIADCVGDEARGDRRTVEVQDRHEPHRINVALDGDEGAQLAVAVLFDHEHKIVGRDEVVDVLMEGEAAHA